MMTRGLVTSSSAEWETPQELFNAIADEFGPFDLDAAASRSNRKCELYLTREDDALACPWTGKVWLNPPYGRQIGAFVEKAAISAKAGAHVVCLLPARTDTAWWHDIVDTHADHVRFLRGRVQFVRGDGKRSQAPFPSALVVFTPSSTVYFGGSDA